MNSLDPTLNRAPFTPEEDKVLFLKQRELGACMVRP